MCFLTHVSNTSVMTLSLESYLFCLIPSDDNVNGGVSLISTSTTNSKFKSEDDQRSIGRDLCCIFVLNVVDEEAFDFSKILYRVIKFGKLKVDRVDRTSASTILKGVFNDKWSLHRALCYVVDHIHGMQTTLTEFHSAGNIQQRVDHWIRCLLVDAVNEIESIKPTLLFHIKNDRVTCPALWNYMQNVGQIICRDRCSLSAALNYSHVTLQLNNDALKLKNTDAWITTHFNNYSAPTTTSTFKSAKKAAAKSTKKSFTAAPIYPFTAPMPSNPSPVDVSSTTNQGPTQQMSKYQNSRFGAPKVDSLSVTRQQVMSLLKGTQKQFDPNDKSHFMHNYCVFYMLRGRCEPPNGKQCTRTHQCPFCNARHSILTCPMYINRQKN